MRLQLRDRDRVDARERLVEQEELRLDGQGAGDLGAPPLAAGEGPGLLPAQVRDAQVVEQLVEPAPLLAPLRCGRVSRMAAMLSSTESLRNTEGSCGR